MNKKVLLIGAIATIAVVVGGWALAQSLGQGRDGFGPSFMLDEGSNGMGPGMMQHGGRGMDAGMGPGMMQHMGRGIGPAIRPGTMIMGHDSATTAQLGVIHELIVNHDRIKRTVTNLPDGIRTVTESDDPQIAQLIKEHVASMDQRVSAGSDPGLPIESPALHSIFRNGAKVRTTIETTAKGNIVVQTSTDPETVAALQQHASEVSDLVQGGMVAVRTAMMKNVGGMMHGGMIGSAPKGGRAPGAR